MIKLIMVFFVLRQAPRSQIIDKTINYIKKLEDELKGLEESKKKKAKMELLLSKQSTSTISLYTSKNSVVDITVSGNVAFFGIQAEMTIQQFLFSRVLKVFEYHKTEILSTTITTINDEQKKIRVTVTALVNSSEILESIEGDIIRLFV